MDRAGTSIEDSAEESAPGTLRFFERAARVLSVAVTLLGALVLADWAVVVPHFERVRAWVAIMKANTAIGFLLVGAALLLRQRRLALPSLALSTTAGVLGLISLAEYALGWNAGIDQLAFKEFQFPTLPPGRMSPATAVLFAVVALAFLLWRVRVRALDGYVAQWLAVAVALAALVFVLGYAYDAPELYRIGRYIPIALPTAAGFFAAALAMLFMRPEIGLMRFVVSDSPAGTMARRLLPSALVFPAAVAWLLLRGERLGWYDLGVELALFASCTIVGFTALIWGTAAALSREERTRRAAEGSLRDAEEDLRATLQSIGDAVIATGASGRVSRMNPVAERLTGWSWAEARGHRLDEVLQLFDESPDQRVEPCVHEILREGSAAPVPHDAFVVSRDGTRRAVSDSCASIRDDAGRIRGAVCVFRDQTEERKIAHALARSESRFRVLASASRSFTEGNLELSRLYAAIARQATQALGDLCVIRVLSEDRQTLRLAALDHVDPEARALLRETLDRDWREGVSEARAGKTVRAGETLLLAGTPSSSLRGAVSPRLLPYVDRYGISSLVAVPLRSHHAVIGTIELARAGSSRPYTPSDASLLAELGERAAEAVHNAQLHHDLQLALDARDDFLAMAGHELKTPLAALLLQVQSALRSRAARPDDPAADRLRRIERSGLRLERLISQLLDVSRIAAGRLVLEPKVVDLAELAREVVARVSEANAAGQSAIVVRGEPRVVGTWDRSRIDQVLTNLLTNALKYGKGEPVELEVLVEGDDAVVRVTDHGIGIEPEHLDRIFERYERAAPAREFGGLGLGLWITRRIAQASGGSIRVESALGTGATFTVRLPRRVPEAQAAT